MRKTVPSNSTSHRNQSLLGRCYLLDVRKFSPLIMKACLKLSSASSSSHAAWLYQSLRQPLNPNELHPHWARAWSVQLSISISSRTCPWLRLTVPRDVHVRGNDNVDSYDGAHSRVDAAGVIGIWQHTCNTAHTIWGTICKEFHIVLVAQWFGHQTCNQALRVWLLAGT